MSYYYRISEREFDTLMKRQGFKQVSLHNVNEKVYHLLYKDIIIRIYSSIEGGGARDRGTDAIRVCCIDPRTGSGLMKNRRVHRVQTWRSNLIERIILTKKSIDKGLVKLAPMCPIEEHGPMVLRIAKKGIFSGNRFWGCSEYPYCSKTKPYKP